MAGSSGFGYRMEAMIIFIQKKGEKEPNITDSTATSSYLVK